MHGQITRLILTLFFAISAIASFAQSSQSFSEFIIGIWVGQGTLFGQEAAFTMEWEHTLQTKFLRLAFVNSFKDQSGIERRMNAEAFYNLHENKGYWFDSRGTMLPLKLELTEQSMTVLWGDEKTEQGKTVYTTLDKDQVKVEDFVLKEGAYVPFGKARYEKSK